ncbi:glycoside hydrolase family 65 protein [Nostoc sp. ChiQUE01b]|uniref:glycoside hydrolase family 65 protein n=1 Tax=Nostoc sp. ChiQUE01b TaxID=3075376 RepID=UPI002AD3AF08|nr:glycosyl hydrolase family 65 protein [Nostoc sp. ChiQUE01b]MDZ8259286.1 hypothetical protein [Nostoc sp. ChiQUE01b]
MFSHNNTHDSKDAWSLVFDGYDPKDEGHREALCALGNGYFVTRAVAIEATADEIHYPGTYRAGLYNRSVTCVEGEASDDESLVNLPNWLPLTFRIDGGDWFSIDTVEILTYRQTLDLKGGVLHRQIQFRDPQGRQTTLHEQRFVSMAQPHLAGLQLQLTAENWSGELEIRSAIDGQVTNNNVKRYEPYNKQHLEPLTTGTIEEAREQGAGSKEDSSGGVESSPVALASRSLREPHIIRSGGEEDKKQEAGRKGENSFPLPPLPPIPRRGPESPCLFVQPEGIWLLVRTKQSRIEIAIAARTRIFVNSYEVNLPRTVDRKTAQIGERLRFQVDQGVVIKIEKIAALYTSRDHAIAETASAARQAILDAPSFAELLNAHQFAWKRLWMRCDIELEPVENLRALRLHIFHILQTVSPHTADLDVGVPARGWHGEDYRGHIFWDETFVLPFLACRFPEIARSMLLYRYRRLSAAKILAHQHGYKGAMFPWRSASTGREETPRFQFNLLSEHWMRDRTNLQHHINAIIACNLWRYYSLTNDLAFLMDYGAEMMVEITRFWASIATYNPECDRYEICGVMGPDEYHTAYPDAETPGINNNTYTNVMAVWTLCRTQEVLDLLPASCCREFCDRLNLSQEEINHWDIVSRKMHIVFGDDGILSQYEGFDRLQEFDVQSFCNQQVNLILEAKGDDVNRYQVSKQADTAMLFFLLSETELTTLLERNGYCFNQTQMQETIAHHLQHTVHESSLSRLVYAGALARCDREKSWQLFIETLFADLSGASSQEAKNGIHLGAMAGTLHLLQHHYLGLHAYGGNICLDPFLPTSLNRFHVSLQHQGNDLEIEVIDSHLNIIASPINSSSVQIVCRGDVMDLQPGTSITFNLLDSVYSVKSQ